MRIAFVMRVEVDEGDGGDAFADGAEDWSGDGVIAAEADGALASFHDFCDRVFDAREGVGRFHGRQVAGVFENSWGVEVDVGFGGFVPGVGVNCFADERRGCGRAAEKRGVVVERNAEEDWRAPRREFLSEKFQGREMRVLPRTSASIWVRWKQSSASS